MRAFRKCLALIFLAAAPLATAAENSWTPLLTQESDQIPGGWLLTADPAISYAVDSTGLHRSDDGRPWRALPVRRRFPAAQPRPRPQLAVDGPGSAGRLDPARPGRPGRSRSLYIGSPQGLYEGSFGDSSRLALVRGRFEARVRWRESSQADWTYGEASSITDQTGVFRLFSPERAEVAVQMLDGRALGGKFWIFAGSMTDQEFTITVRDLESGAVKTYPNPPGGFAGFGDTRAF
jgi:hypothetical protein